MQRGLPTKRPIQDVSKVIAVSSAKGGVGKSTVAGNTHILWIYKNIRKEDLTFNTVNVALALARKGRRTGILDTDIFGPSIPKLMSLSGEPRLSERMTPHLQISCLNRFVLRTNTQTRQSVDTIVKLWCQNYVHGIYGGSWVCSSLARTYGHEGSTTTATRSRLG